MSSTSANAAASSSTANASSAERGLQDGKRAGGGGQSQGQSSDLWSDILKSADRGSRGNWTRKNVLLLSERHHGRKHLLTQLTSTTSSKRRNTKRNVQTAGPSLAMGYEVLEVREDGDEDSVPPVSIFYPPSSHTSMLRLLPKSLPPKALASTAVVIVLDWTKPSSMIRELLTWLSWVDEWAASLSAEEWGVAEEMHERLQSHIQHYTEPPAVSPGTTSAPLTSYAGGPLLPLGQGTLTLNKSGVPIIVVCTRADLMDSIGDELGMKGQWEERTDWIQQVLRTICLAHGAALFYTSPTSPSTYTLLRTYLLHRLYTIPPPLNPTDGSDTQPPQQVKFPFSHRANVLDRDAVMVPTGWDSWGKINVLRERFDPSRVNRAWDISRSREFEGEVGESENENEQGIEDLWDGMIPDTSKPRITTGGNIMTTSEPEQSFLSRQLDVLLKDPQRDPRASFRQAAAVVSANTQATTGGAAGTDAGVVGPMGSGGLNLPGVEKVMNEMEGAASVEDMKEKFARLGRRETGRTAGGPLSPTGAGPTDGRPSTVPNEALHNFFQGLLATKGKSSTPAKTPAPPTSAKPSTKLEQ